MDDLIPDGAVLLACIRIARVLEADGTDQVYTIAEDSTGAALGLTEAFGMLHQALVTMSTADTWEDT